MAWLAARPAAGQLPNPRITGLVPGGGRVGETCDVVVRGEDLDEPQAIVFSHPGISGTPTEIDLPAWRRNPGAPYTVKIAPDVPAGRYEARVSGRFGLSTAWPFFVGDKPVVPAQPGIVSADKAMSLEPDTVVEGELGERQMHFYRFRGTPGQRFVITCESRPLHGRLDLMLQVTGPDDALVASDYATAHREPVIPLTIREAGDHLIRVNERHFGFSGNPVARYRITLGTRPHLVHAWPPVATTAASGTHRLLGYLLPGGRPVGERGLESLEVAIPAATAVHRRSGAASPLAWPATIGLEAFPYRLDTPAGASNPIAMAVSAAPPLVEEEPNPRSAAQRVTVPCDIVGRFDDTADTDWFCFDARQGERFAVEIQAQRLGVPADVAVVVEQVDQDPQGAERVRTVAEQDDPPPRFSHPPCEFATADPWLVFTAEREGTYRVGVRDNADGSHADTGGMYRLLVRPAAADFRLVATVGDLRDNPRFHPTPHDRLFEVPAIPRLRRGGRVPVAVQVHRRDGFDGPVTLGVEGLPPGVTAAPATIAAGVNEGFVVIAAGDTAAAWRGPIRVTGAATIAGQDRVRQAEWAALSSGWHPTQPDFVRLVLVDEMPLDVLAEPAPLRVAISQADFAPVPQGGKVKIPFTVEAAGQMQGPLRIELRELPVAKPTPPYPQTPLKEIDPAPHSGELEVTIPGDTPPGVHSLHLVAKVKLPVARNPEAATAATKAKADFATQRASVQEAADASRTAAEAAAAAVQAVARLPDGPDKKQAVADAEAVRKAADEAHGKARAKLEAVLRDEKTLEHKVAEVQKANEPKPTDVYAVSLPISLTVTKPEPAAAPQAAWIGPLVPLIAQAAAALAVIEERRSIDFDRDVLPILRANCIACHTAAEPEGGVVLETPETMQRPREGGPALVPGKAAESLVSLLAAHEREPVMPPVDNDRGARRLSAVELDILRGWIDAGAKAAAAGPRAIQWQAFPPGVRSMYATAVAADGRLAVTGITNRITVFDVAAGKPVARLVDPTLPEPVGGGPRTAAHLDAVRGLAFSPDGTRLASGAMRTVTVWQRSDDGAGGEPAWRPERRIGSVEKADPFVGRVSALAFSPGGLLLAAGTGEPTVNGEVVILAVDTGAVVHRIPVPHADTVGCLAFSPDGRWLATGANHAVGIYDVSTGRRAHEFNEHAGRVLAVDWKADGTALTSVGADGKACVWKAGPWEKIESIGLAGRGGVGVRYRGATDTFFVAEGDGRVRVRGVGLSGTQPEFAATVDRIQCLAADAAGDVVVAGGMDGVLRVWSGAGGEPKLLEEPGP